MSEKTVTQVEYKSVTQPQYISHQQALIKKLRSKILNGISKLSCYEMKKLTDAVTYRQKLVGFARSGKMKEFFI